MALDAAGNVFVADSGNGRIQKFLATGFVLDDADADDGDAIGSSITYDRLPTGVYQVTESAASSWELVDFTCTGDNVSQITIDLVNRALTIDLVADEHVICTAANRLR